MPRYLDPTGMELVRLGQHTDQQINDRVAEIDAELKKEGLTDKQTQSLQSERNTLQFEQEGNHAVQVALDKLNSTGQGNGLKLSDFTLSTDPKNDFRAMTAKRGYKGEALEKELDNLAGGSTG